MADITREQYETELATYCAEYADDPLGWVMAAFSWETEPTIQLCELPEKYQERFPGRKYGPDLWACDLLDRWGQEIKARAFDGRHAVMPVYIAVSSGHGTGKSVFSAWAMLFLMSTRPFMQGTVTAPVAPQLRLRTWATLKTWARLCITGHWFEFVESPVPLVYHKKHKEQWFIAARTCTKDNYPAFQGQHAATSTSFFLFDEASGVDDIFFEAAEGGLSDGEGVFLVLGNMNYNVGTFYEIIYGKERGKWITQVIDSRQAQITNKAKIEADIKKYGIDSDFVRTRWLGLPPNQAVQQFIDRLTVDTATESPEPVYAHGSVAAIVGVDCAREGDDESVICVRMGKNGRVLDWWAGQEKNSVRLATRIAATITKLQKMGLAVHTFIDKGGVGGAVVDMVREMGHINVYEVGFGNKADDSDHYANKRIEMWDTMREWLEGGGVIPAEAKLTEDLLAPLLFHDRQDRKLLEPKDAIKKRTGRSTDWADALACTFYFPVVEQVEAMRESQAQGIGGGEHSPNDFDPVFGGIGF